MVFVAFLVLNPVTLRLFAMAHYHRKTQGVVIVFGEFLDTNATK